MADGIVVEEKLHQPPSQSETREELQYRLANERNKLRWAHQRAFENLQMDENDEERNVIRRRNSICQAVKMTKIVLNLQEALYRGRQHDTKKAVECLNEISQQLFTPTSLLYAPYVVRSVYSLCIYKYSEEVRTTARKCYRKFSPCFGVNVLQGETFESTFQAQVRKFWETQDHISYDPSKYNWKEFDMKKKVSENDAEGNYCYVDVDHVKLDNDSSLIKKELHIEVKGEALDENDIVKEELCFEVDQVDDKTIVKKELTGLEGEGSSSSGIYILPPDIKIKEEKPDSDVEDVNMDNAYNDIEDVSISPDINLEPEVQIKTENYDLPELRVKIEPIDLEKLNAEYNPKNDCFILGL